MEMANNCLNMSMKIINNQNTKTDIPSKYAKNNSRNTVNFTKKYEWIIK